MSPTSRNHKLTRQRALSGSPATKLAQHGASGLSATKLAQRATKPRIWTISRAPGELSRAHPHIRPHKANDFARRTRQRSDFETNDTFAPTDAGQHETTITTAHP